MHSIQKFRINAKEQDSTIANLESVNQKTRVEKIVIRDSIIKKRDSRPKYWKIIRLYEES